MSRWTEQLSSHAIWTTIEKIKEHIAVGFDETDDEWFTEKRRLTEIIVHIEEVLSKLNAERISFIQIDSLNNHLTQHIIPQTQAFSTSGDLQNLRAANDQITNLISQLSILQSLFNEFPPASQIEKLDELADEFAKTISNKRSSLEEEIDKLQTELAQHNKRQQELSDAMDAKKRETDTIITDWQNQFSQAQQSRLDDFNSLRKQIETDAKKGTDTLIAEKENDFTSLLDKTNKDVDMTMEKTKKTTTELVSDAQDKHNAILELYNMVAEDSVAGGYSKNANDEAKQANNWRKFTVRFIITTASWLFAVVVYTIIFQAKGFVWTWYLPVFSLTSVLLFGAAYSAQQSTKHRNNEKRDRWFALQVKAIDPFISSLNETQQQELKKELSAQLFGNAHEEDTSQLISEHALVVFTKSVTEIMKASKK